MVRAPLMAVKVPTNLPSPEIGKMSPYLSSDKFECYFHSFIQTSLFVFLPDSCHGDDDPVEGGGNVSEARVILLTIFWSILRLVSNG